jgi:nucleoside-diphosphate-sugar epimerase
MMNFNGLSNKQAFKKKQLLSMYHPKMVNSNQNTFPKILITGATGFIGGALAARLITTEVWDQVLFLTRGMHEADGLSRLAQNLRQHGVNETLVQKLQLHQILCGDLMNVPDWIDDPRLPSIQHVVNSAAVASFGKHPTIFPTNVDGVLQLAHGLNQRASIQRFLQISTGMACGLDAPIPVPEDYKPSDDTAHYLDYTQSKFEAERRLRDELPDFPTVVVRPTIVVGHTQLGCAASGSIYWVFRLARALQAFPCRLDQKIDVIPVDYCAQALHHLLLKPALNHRNYHISAGAENACTFGEIDAAIAAAIGEEPMHHYKQTSYEKFVEMQDQFRTRIGPCNKRIVLKAILSYGYFAAEEVLFSNAHLLSEGLPAPTPFVQYAGLCEQTSRDILIADQMKYDYK